LIGLVEHGAAADLAVDDHRRDLALAEAGDVDLLGDLLVRRVEARLELLEGHLDGQLGPGRAQGLDGALHRCFSLVSWWVRCRAVSCISGCAGTVGATGLEPAVSCSQSRRASHYATPRQVAPNGAPGALGADDGNRTRVAVWKTGALPLSYIRARKWRPHGAMVPHARSHGATRHPSAPNPVSAGGPAAARGRRCASRAVDEARAPSSKPPRSSRSAWPWSRSMPRRCRGCGSRPGRRCRAAARRPGASARRPRKSASSISPSTGPSDSGARSSGRSRRELHRPAGDRPLRISKSPVTRSRERWIAVAKPSSQSWRSR
jgi:hypothetical protein